MMLNEIYEMEMGGGMGCAFIGSVYVTVHEYPS